MDKYKNHNIYEMGNKINSYLILAVKAQHFITLSVISYWAYTDYHVSVTNSLDRTDSRRSKGSISGRNYREFRGNQHQRLGEITTSGFVVDLAISQKSVAEIVVEIVVEAKMRGEGLVSKKIKNFHKIIPELRTRNNRKHRTSDMDYRSTDQRKCFSELYLNLRISKIHQGGDLVALGRFHCNEFVEPVISCTELQLLTTRLIGFITNMLNHPESTNVKATTEIANCLEIRYVTKKLSLDRLEVTILNHETSNIAFSVCLQKHSILFTCLLNYRNSKNKNSKLWFICKILNASENSGKDPALPISCCIFRKRLAEKPEDFLITKKYRKYFYISYNIYVRNLDKFIINFIYISYVTNTKFDKNNMKKNNDNSTNNGNIILIFTLKLYSLKSYGRELQHMLKSTLLDN
ncbi:hypothetical protein H8356DRAFT_1366321 [Neocallimastix lanati (nom. inval.)]|nr:hypothetical protein H8356DRAFT_1366321 [Neocallimastix sp. JGI-2020a]